MDRPSRWQFYVVRPRDRSFAAQIRHTLVSFDSEEHPLPGVRNAASLGTFVEQILESVRRVNYVAVVAGRNISELRADPSSELFDPLKGAVLKIRQNDIEEAFWLVFLFVHLGKHSRYGWHLARDIYGALGNTGKWTWNRVSTDPKAFREWLAANRPSLRGAFGNHRKYESLDAKSGSGTGAAVESYVRWVRPPRTHKMLIEALRQSAGNDPKVLFNLLYESLNAVSRFGRTARFDYLTMIGKLGLAPVEPGSTYMQGATGPFSGACLLFNGSTEKRTNRSELDSLVAELGARLGVGMQVMEDALCNWQKSPIKFVAFRG